MKADREFTAASAAVLASIVAAAALNSMVVARTGNALLLEPLSHSYGWSHAQLGATISFLMTGIAIGTPVAGILVDRFGPRALLLPFTAAAGLTLSLLAFSGGSLPLFYAGHFVLGLVSPGPLAYAKMISGWFVRRRGAALLAIGIGFFLAQFSIPLIVRWVLDQFGWRAVFLGYGLVELFIALPILALFFRERAPRAREEPAPAARPPARSAAWLAEMIADRNLWLLLAMQVCIGGVWLGLQPHIVGIFAQHGVARADAAWGMSLFAVGGIAGQIAAGFLVDQFDTPRVTLPFAMLAIIALILLINGLGGRIGLLLAMTLLGAGLNALSNLSYLVTRFFGVVRFGLVYGIMAPFQLILEAPAPLVVGHIFDVEGSYQPALLAGIAMLLLGGLALICLRRYPDARIVPPGMKR